VSACDAHGARRRVEASRSPRKTITLPGGTMTRTLTTLLAALATTLCIGARAADAPAGTGISKAETKDLKTQSEAQYDARKKVAEANETLNKADCKSALDGAAKRACESSAKAAAKSQKADAKTVHEVEEKAIKDAKK
jgi:hypothetical protein